MNQVLEIDEKNFTATVQAGITIWELNEVLARKGLWLPHQPESNPLSFVILYFPKCNIIVLFLFA